MQKPRLPQGSRGFGRLSGPGGLLFAVLFGVVLLGVGGVLLGVGGVGLGRVGVVGGLLVVAGLVVLGGFGVVLGGLGVVGGGVLVAFGGFGGHGVGIKRAPTLGLCTKNGYCAGLFGIKFGHRRA